MLARIVPVKSLYGTLYYNEHKQQEAKGIPLLARNFLKDIDELGHQDILDRFRQRTSLNERPEKNILHIFLNFDISDRLTDDQMKRIAGHYMQSMGFDRQPWLLYRHFDAAHPHLHVISTNIRADGSRIDIKLRDLSRSAELTTKLEEEYSLVKNIDARQQQQSQFEVRQAQRVIYGQMGLKRSISNVLNAVVEHYQYSSLREFNAVLQLYNVRAERGEPSSKLYQHRGLIYHALDENGNKVGKYIAASSLLLKPTLANLEKKFERNRSLQEELRQRVTTAIDWTLAGKAPDWKGFREAMEKEGISVVVPDGSQEGTASYFIDHREKTVFAGESLGRRYSLQEIRERCSKEENLEQEETQRQHLHLRL